MVPAALIGLVYVILGVTVLPLTVVFLWTGIRAFRAVRRAVDGMKACPRCGREVINPEARHCGKCGGELVAR